VKQILTNFVNNVLKFTPKNGIITVRAGLWDQDRDFIRVSVADTGCGITPGDAEKIFDRLYQVENSLDTNRNGLGLGLHITRELVVRHGGTIWADGHAGEGAIFNFTMPMFSLKRLLESLFGSDGQPASSLSLISVELLPDPRSPIEVAKAIQEMTWLTLNGMELPQRAALFPNIVASGERGLFYIVQAKDLESSAELASRIEKEIVRSKQFRNANCRIRTAVSPVEIPPSVQAVDIGRLAAQIDAQISRAVAAKLDPVAGERSQTAAASPNDYPAVA
jgi:hypothetical protein